MSKYGLGDLQQALRAYLQSGLDSGQVADAGNIPNTYLTAANKTWLINQWVGCYVQIVDGLALGQFLQVASNTVDTIIFVEPWIPVIPDTTSIYKIMLPSPGMGIGTPVEITNTSDIDSSLDSGIVTARTVNTLSDTSKNWVVDGLAGAIVKITEGTGIGQLRLIDSNTANQLTLTSAWATEPGIGARYTIMVTVTAMATLVAFTALSVHNTSVGAVLDVVLDTGLYGGRTNIEVWVSSSVAATFTVYGSRNGANWREIDTITLAAPGEAHGGYTNAYRYIRAATADAANNEIEIVASR